MGFFLYLDLCLIFNIIVKREVTYGQEKLPASIP